MFREGDTAARRQGRLEPQDRQGRRDRQYRRGQPGGRHRLWRHGRADRHAEGRRGRQYAAGARRGRPARGRARATRKRRRSSTLDHAAYTPCAVDDRRRLPQGAELEDHRGRVVHDPIKHRICYHGRAARAVRPADPVPLPGLSHPDGGRAAASACWSPTSATAASTGSSSALPYYFQLAPNRDLTITPHVYTERAADAGGAISRADRATAPSRSPAMLTYSSRLPRRPRRGPPIQTATRRSAAISTPTARFQLDPDWSDHRLAAADAPTAPSCAATTSRATTGCARRSTPSGSTPTAISRSPAGRSQTLRAGDRAGPAADRAARDRLSPALRRSAARRRDRSCRPTASR